jgi:hypothetical protein
VERRISYGSAFFGNDCGDCSVTLATARILTYWRHHNFEDVRHSSARSRLSRPSSG